MKNLLYFFLGIIFTVMVASTGVTRELFIVQPSIPKSTVILCEYSYGGHITIGLDKQAVPYLKRGYIIKLISVSTPDSGDKISGYMVLEKY